jgi:hypothetical protein
MLMSAHHVLMMPGAHWDVQAQVPKMESLQLNSQPSLTVKLRRIPTCKTLHGVARFSLQQPLTGSHHRTTCKESLQWMSCICSHSSGGQHWTQVQLRCIVQNHGPSVLRLHGLAVCGLLSVCKAHCECLYIALDHGLIVHRLVWS